MAFGVETTFLFLLVGSKTLIFCCADSNLSTDYAMNLEDYLKTIRHHPNVPPIKNVSKLITDPMEIEFVFLISHLISLDGAKQKIKITAYLTLSWPEERLVWNPSAFGNIFEIRRDSKTIWHPRIYVYNGVGDAQEISPPEKSLIYHINENESYATYVIRRDFSAGCTFNVINFPNDIQTCEFQLYSADMWTKPKKDPFNTTVLALYNPSNEWTLVHHKIEVLFKTFKVQEPDMFMKIPLFVCTLVYRRVYIYYIMNVVVPILLLSFLQTLVFFVPTESGEKMSLGITILLSFTVFLLLLDNILPKSVNMPIISIFITSSMCLSALSLFLTSVILRLYHTPIKRKMPNLIHVILVNVLGKLMCVNKEHVTVEKVASIDLNDKFKSCTCNSEIEESTNSKEQKTISNPWIIAALSMERLMLLLGFLLMIAMVLGLIVPTFL